MDAREYDECLKSMESEIEALRTRNKMLEKLSKAFDALNNHTIDIEIRDNVNELFVTVDGVRVFQDYYGDSYIPGNNHSAARLNALTNALQKVHTKLSHYNKGS